MKQILKAETRDHSQSFRLCYSGIFWKEVDHWNCTDLWSCQCVDIGLLYLHGFCKTLLDAKGTTTEDPHPRNIEQTKARSRQQTRDQALEQGILRRQEKGCWCLAAGEGIGCPKPPMLSCLVWRCWDSWYHGNGDRHDDCFIIQEFSKGEGLDWQHIRNEFYTAMPESFGEVSG